MGRDSEKQSRKLKHRRRAATGRERTTIQSQVANPVSRIPSVLDRLLGVDSLAGSLGVYVPAAVLQKALGLVRVLLFTYLLSHVQYGLWGLSIMVFTLGGAVLTLGSNHGVVRYVSLYEAQGRLAEFYRRVSWSVLILGVVLTAGALAGSGFITRWAFASRPTVAVVLHSEQLRLCQAALANALLVALYHNMLGFMFGMRAYRLVSVVEVCFSVLFTAAGVAAIALAPGEWGCMAVLAAHGATMIATMMVGMALLNVAVRRLASAGTAPLPGSTDADAIILDPGSEADGAISATPVPTRDVRAAGPADRGGVARVMTFGIVASVGTLLWNGAFYVSFRLTGWFSGEAAAGVFAVFLQLSQPIVFIANAAWTVLFTHVARRWEQGERQSAMLSLQTAYKAVVLTAMTLAVVLSVSSPLWVGILKDSYRHGLPILGGMLMFFQVLNHLTLLTILAKLHERPWVIGLAVLAGGVANAILALIWIPTQGAEGAAWAAGVGMYVGGTAVAAAYLLAARVRLNAGTWLALLLPPVLLLAPRPILLSAAWAAVLIAAVASGVLFSRQERQLLRSFLSIVVRKVMRRSE